MIKPLASTEGARRRDQTSRAGTIPGGPGVYVFPLFRCVFVDRSVRSYFIDRAGGQGTLQATADVADQGKRDGPGNQCHVVQRAWGHPDRHTSLDPPNQHAASLRIDGPVPQAVALRASIPATAGRAALDLLKKGCKPC